MERSLQVTFLKELERPFRWAIRSSNLVPHGDWELRLHAAESIIADLQPGQTGYFSSNARPEASLDCEIQGILPGAQAVDGASVYYVDAVLKENPEMASKRPWRE